MLAVWVSCAVPQPPSLAHNRTKAQADHTLQGPYSAIRHSPAQLQRHLCAIGAQQAHAHGDEHGALVGLTRGGLGVLQQQEEAGGGPGKRARHTQGFEGTPADQQQGARGSSSISSSAGTAGFRSEISLPA